MLGREKKNIRSIGRIAGILWCDWCIERESIYLWIDFGIRTWKEEHGGERGCRRLLLSCHSIDPCFWFVLVCGHVVGHGWRWLRSESLSRSWSFTRFFVQPHSCHHTYHFKKNTLRITKGTAFAKSRGTGWLDWCQSPVRWWWWHQRECASRDFVKGLS